MVSEKTSETEAKTVEVKEKKPVTEKKNTEKQRMLLVDFSGKELLNNEVFDTTIENVAKENDIYNKDRAYGALTIITGEKDLLAKVEKELVLMKEGEEKVVPLTPKDSFGERQSDLVRILPFKVFQEQKVNPVPGLVINVGNALGKVQSVSGGRVRVDFNHPLAGRNVEYTIKLVKEVKAKKEIAEKLFEKYYSQVPGSKKEIKEEVLYITLPSDSFKGLEKLNEVISGLGKSLGIKTEFKEGKAEKKKEVPEAKE
jgi:FKBP-type peptidyl-prolyl cis-trans isomerase 2